MIYHPLTIFLIGVHPSLMNAEANQSDSVLVGQLFQLLQITIVFAIHLTMQYIDPFDKIGRAHV